jgi:hypothetical protein
VLVCPCVFAQALSNRSSVVDAAGQWCGGGSWSNIFAAGQPGGVACSSGGQLHHTAGFLSAFVLQPGLDTDGDGLPNELDTDNDGDTLLDTVEMAGTAFDPVTPTDHDVADADRDGQDDGAEAAAGTDPADGQAFLQIIDITRSSPDATLSWVARGGKTYRVLQREDLTTGTWGALATTNATGGSAPWYVVTNSFTDTDAGTVDTRFYEVEVVP